MKRQVILNFFLITLAVVTISAVFLWHKHTASLPPKEGDFALTGLKNSASVSLDILGIPTISASNRLDALTSLGYFIARDRMFQADLMRRKSAGTLAEVLGEKVLNMDRRQRYLGFHRAAKKIVDNLPNNHQQALQAFSQGFNSYLNHASELPPEFLILGYQPQPWSPKDSILIALGLFQQLTWSEPSERMLTIMKKALPDDVVNFFTPGTDRYETVMIGDSESQHGFSSIPVDSLSNMPLTSTDNYDHISLEDDTTVVGSNNWAVNGSKTADGRAILANDMHLALMVPNIWYRAKLRYNDMALSGIFLPGLPLLIAGANNHVAWGHTNALADVVDLVKLEINPDDRSQYLTPSGWKRFDTVTETIKIKRKFAEAVTVHYTIWGPVSPKPLLNHQVAVHWTARQSQAINLMMLELDAVTNVEEAIRVFNRSGIPPTNVLVADNNGNIGWTYSGIFPNRVGFDGSTSHSWSKENIGWHGYTPAHQIPNVVNPPSEILVTANDRILGSDYPLTIGHDYAYAYRAYHIRNRLSSMKNIGEKDMLNLQMDSSTEFYEFYRRLALSALQPNQMNDAPILKIAMESIKQWNGKADPESVGLPILAEFRRVLARRVILPYLAACKNLEPTFYYRWFKYEAPLRRLLSAKIPTILPDKRFEDWNALIIDSLLTGVKHLKRKFPEIPFPRLTWGKVNPVEISHPFSRVVPWLSRFLDMPKAKLGGCSYCVKVIKHRYGATERLVISPSKFADGILLMPTGQSGHPLSPHYRDQHQFWEQGTIRRFDPGPGTNFIRLVPVRS